VNQLTKALVARFGPPSPAVQAARWLPIPRPLYKDLPPTMQYALARRLQDEEDAAIAAQQPAQPMHPLGVR
jgi:hypothetical protein